MTVDPWAELIATQCRGSEERRQNLKQPKGTGVRRYTVMGSWIVFPKTSGDPWLAPVSQDSLHHSHGCGSLPDGDGSLVQTLVPRFLLGTGTLFHLGFYRNLRLGTVKASTTIYPM